ncbi:translation elongation factor Ts [candidate division WOR-3 bacterium JGI_Cruoil_03_51_56]|uniref:Elongation factor Ts n=1 Tax=candidate division WOR-3 bacterium JGI_Cruoil_03_51_56 TaxID=1973747 RepID=A0A235BSW7_UNCW3|nr:MAG: translation elongation factor Ts [candidate division WOR-3 bacterium JGI_Cruoil_03_51_56]
MNQPINKVKELRHRTSAGVLNCKQALEEANGDIDKAIEVLRKKGITKAAKKAERTTSAGLVDAYIHPGERLGVLIEVNVETDFVARNQEFRRFVRDLSLQVAAADPVAIDRDGVPVEIIEREKRIYKEQVSQSGKPARIAEKIIQGKLEKFYADVCLLEQPFVKTPGKTVGDYLKEQIAKFGENIRIKRFVRFKVGE